MRAHESIFENLLEEGMIGIYLLARGLVLWLPRTRYQAGYSLAKADAARRHFSD